MEFDNKRNKLIIEGDAKPQPGPMATPELIGKLVTLLHSDPSITTVGIPLESLYLTGLPAPNLLKGKNEYNTNIQFFYSSLFLKYIFFF